MPDSISVVCFRYAPLALRNDEEALDALNKRIMESIQAGGAAFISSTTLRNRFSLRACILHYGTTEGDLIALLATVHCCLQCTDVVPGVTRLTPQQRAWAREQFGVALPRVIRSDEPLSRRISIETWRIAIAARNHPKLQPRGRRCLMRGNTYEFG